MSMVKAPIFAISTAALLFGASASFPPPNDGPDPFTTIPTWGHRPDNRKWGSTAGVTVGPDGNIWAYDRCGANSCADSGLDPILEFDVKTGNVLRHFGKGLFVQPHGFFVDKQG